MKRNGFCLPLHYLQVGAWVTVALLGGLYYSLILPSLSATAYLPLLTFYSCGFLLVLLAGFICTKTDPTDTAVKVKLGVLKERYDYSKFPRLCIKCSTHVGLRSKHCNKCDRCTAEFDHHCDWLNNCIGKDNYRWFVVLILSLEVCMAIEITAALVLLKEVFDDRSEEMRDRFEVGESGYAFVCALVLVAVLCVSIVTSNGYLLLFHLYLAVRRLTTYEFILLKRAPKQKVAPSSGEQRYDHSTFQLEMQVPAADSRPIVPHCTPIESAPKSVELKENSLLDGSHSVDKGILSRTIDISSLPSFVERPTEHEPGASYQYRKAREDSVVPMEEDNEFLHDGPAAAGKNRLHSSPAEV